MPIAVDPLRPMTIRLVSRHSDGTQGNGWSGDVDISDDGRFVAFETDASNLVTGDTNSRPDVVRHDLTTGETIRISQDNDGSQLSGFSYDANISGDGRYVTFETSAALNGASDANAMPDVYLMDVATGSATLVSRNDSGGTTAGAGRGPSYVAEISASGRYVVFVSEATDIADADDPNGNQDVYLRDLQAGVTTLISQTPDGQGSDDDSYDPSVSADGRYISFVSYAQNLTPDQGTGPGTPGFFLHDSTTGETQLLQDARFSGATNAKMSDDGRYVVFEATNVGGNGAKGVFRYDITADEVVLVSASAGGQSGNNVSYQPDVSADGRFVVFNSIATDLINGDTNGVSDVFVKDMQTGQIARVSMAEDGTQANGQSYDPSISADGSTISFQSNASNLVDEDTNGTSDVFAVGNPLLGATNENQAPEWVSQDASSALRAALETPGLRVDVDLRDYIIDPDGDPLTLEFSGLPEGLTFDPDTGRITGFRESIFPQGTTLSLTASDPSGASLSVSMSGGGFPPGFTPWDFDFADPADIALFAHMANDAYNGDESANIASTIVRPPEGWSVIRTTWDAVGGRPRDADGNLIAKSILVDAPQMQAVAYREDDTGRIVISYRGTDDAGNDEFGPELIGTSIALGLGIDQEGKSGDFVQTEDYLKGALQFYTDVVDQYATDASNISFTGHSLGGMLAGYVGGYTGGSGMIFASGPHTSMFEFLGTPTDYLGAAAVAHADYGFIEGAPDLANLSHTRITGEMLGLGVGALTDAINVLDLVVPFNTLTGLGIGYLNNTWGDAENLAVLLGELDAGTSLLAPDGLSPVELHSMSLHQIITHGSHTLGLTNYLDIDNFPKAFFDNELAASVRVAMSGGPETAADMFRLATLGIYGAGPDVVTDLLRDAEDIASRSTLPSLGLIEPGAVLNRTVMQNATVETALIEIMLEHAYRSMVAQMDGNTGLPVFGPATFVAPPLAGWRDVDLGAMNGGRWHGLVDFYREVQQDSDLDLDLDRAGYGIRDHMYVRSDQTGTGVLTTAAGSDDLVIGGTGPGIQGVNINAGAGNDLILGSTNDDVIKVQSGANVLLGGDGEDLILGATDFDQIDGGRHNDQLYGAGGRDFIHGGEGADQMFGGKGRDDLFGGSGSDSLMGQDGGDTLMGGGGFDELFGGKHDDFMDGGSHKDTLVGGAGNDTLKGGTGADILKGGDDRDKLTGGGANDTLYGGSGLDTLSGGAGKDRLFGDSGQDELRGGDAKDTLTGGIGQDKLTGGAGNDVFVFNTVSDSAKGAKLRDTITDFSRDADLIDLSEIDAKAGGLFNNRFGFVGQDTVDGKGELGYKVVSKGVLVQAEVDGDGIVDFELLVEGVARLGQSDFLL